MGISVDDTRGDEKVEIEDKNGNKIVFECKTDKLVIDFKGDIEMKASQNIKIEAGMGISIEAGTTFKGKGGVSRRGPQAARHPRGQGHRPDSDPGRTGNDQHRRDHGDVRCLHPSSLWQRRSCARTAGVQSSYQRIQP